MVPVIHKQCGGQTAWYLRDTPRNPDIATAEDYVRLDGSRPKIGELFREVCAHCGKFIVAPDELERDFSAVHPLDQSEGKK